MASKSLIIRLGEAGTRVGNTPEAYQCYCLGLLTEALWYDEFPVGEIVALDGEIVGQGTTTEQRERRFLGHAEMLALEQAYKLQLSFDERRRARLFTNLEPCLMRMGAAMSFFLGEIVYGLESPGDGGVGLVRAWQRKEEDIPSYQVPKITGGLLREESIGLFEEYVARCPPGPMRDWAETLTRLG